MLADDLTGALDAAAALASRREPVAVVWSSDNLEVFGRLSIDTESRHMEAGESAARVADALRAVAQSDLTFKKFDSLIRGNTIAELLACCRSRLFGSFVIAPAFPSQGRVTRGGQQFARQSDGSWAPAGHNLFEAILVILGGGTMGAGENYHQHFRAGIVFKGVILPVHAG